MLNAVIRAALRYRLVTLGAALLLVVVGLWQTSRMVVDVFPDLNRPRVTILTEAPGMAPEEVETLISFPLETAINGATGVRAVRSYSIAGLSLLIVDFEWGTDIYTDRQIVAERMQLAADQLPEGITPMLTPISSLMGQIMIIGMHSRDGSTDALELRTLADWVLRTRLLTIPGVAQVITMGGGRMQFQVLVSPEALIRYEITLDEVKQAVAATNENATGGWLDEQGDLEWLVRSLGRIKTVEDLKKTVVAVREGRPILLEQVARVIEGPQVKRGDSSAYVRTADGRIEGGPAVVLTVLKQPQADTRVVTEKVIEALQQLRPSLPKDVELHPNLYQQRGFIDRAIDNVVEALRDGAVLVVLVLFLFLFNLRVTIVALTAIPLSLLMTALVCAAFGVSINTMILGGIAVAIGELVDDAIVDVENIFRRLKENRHREKPRHPLLVVFAASAEIRNSIVFGTLLVVLVFFPLFALSGMEGRLFSPVALAYIVSLMCSLLVSLTVTPVLSYWLLATRWFWWLMTAVLAVCTGGITGWVLQSGGMAPGLAWGIGTAVGLGTAVVLVVLDWLGERFEHGLLMPLMQALATPAIRFSLRFPWLTMGTTAACVAVATWGLLRLERDFLPPFNEGSIQANVILPPGTSLPRSNEVGEQAAKTLLEIPEVLSVVRRTGRAELDEHAEGVYTTELILNLDPHSEKSREELIEEVREKLKDIPARAVAVEQPLAHMISAMLSGVKAQVAIKIFGDDLNLLRTYAQEAYQRINGIPGVRDLQVEPMVLVPQIRVEVDRDALARYGLHVEDINQLIETAMNGTVVSEALIGQRRFDILVRMEEKYREDLDWVRRLVIHLPGGGAVTLSDVARVYEAAGPNTINREGARRRIFLSCNVADRGLVDVVEDIKRALQPLEAKLPPGYFIVYGGQFERQQTAARQMKIFIILALLGVFLLLFTLFRSVNFALQVMMALPAAFIGSVAMLYLTGQTFTVAAMVGFVSLCGIAARNGILLINHYIHLVEFEGEQWDDKMIVRGGRERTAPVLMTALTSGIGLLPIVMAPGEAGKEILYPLATVVVGGLITSTLLEFLLRPAMFKVFGLPIAPKVVSAHEAQVLEVHSPEELFLQEEDQGRSTG